MSKKGIRLNSIKIANYKQFYYDSMNSIEKDLNRYNQLYDNYLSMLDCIKNILVEIDIEIKKISREINDLNRKMGKSTENINSTNIEKIDGNNCLQLLNLKKSELERKKILLLEKKKEYKRSKKTIKKNLSIVNNNINRCNENIYETTLTLKKFDIACVDGISYISEKDFKPKIKKMKRIKGGE